MTATNQPSDERDPLALAVVAFLIGAVPLVLLVVPLVVPSARLGVPNLLAMGSFAFPLGLAASHQLRNEEAVGGRRHARAAIALGAVSLTLSVAVLLVAIVRAGQHGC